MDDDAAIAGPSVDVQIEDGVRKGKCGVGAQSSALALPRPRAELSMACTAIVWPQCGNTHHHPACLAKFSQCPEKALTRVVFLLKAPLALSQLTIKTL